MSSKTYFENLKKGEVEELMMLLRDASMERDQRKQREVIKRVVAYMTLGIDVSALFSQMIMASNTSDLVQKKLVYLYLCNYAENNPDVSLLCINTLQKDCSNVSPKIRGLALRSLYAMSLLPSRRTNGAISTCIFFRFTNFLCAKIINSRGEFE
jgi:AP-4 complex subunit beta-1